jgi:hypothetical protein
MSLTRTTSDAVSDARRHLQDQAPPYRYPDTDLVDYANQGLSAMYRLRPELMLGGGWKPAAPITLTDPLPERVGDWFFAALVAYMVGLANLRDSQTTDDSRAVAMMARLQQTLQGQGV